MRRAAALMVGIVLAGCAGGPPLLDERTAEPYASLLAQARRLPRTTARVPAGVEPGAGPWIEVTYVASPAPSGELVVMVNGIFSAASTSFRFVEGVVGAAHDLLLVDLPGTGGSDKPEFTRAPADAYTRDWLAAHLLRAVDRWSAENGRSDRLAFVGHSLGGAALLCALADPSLRSAAPDVVARVQHLVLISPPDVVIANPSERLADLERLDQPLLDLLCLLGVARPLLEDGIRGSVVDPCRDALAQEMCNFGRALIGCETRRATKAMLRRYHPTRPDGSIDEAEAARLRALQTHVTVPCLILSGSDDDIVEPANGRALADRLPNATYVCLEAKHSVHQERATEVGPLIRAFLAGEPVEARSCPDG